MILTLLLKFVSNIDLLDQSYSRLHRNKIIFISFGVGVQVTNREGQIAFFGITKFWSLAPKTELQKDIWADQFVM